MGKKSKYMFLAFVYENQKDKPCKTLLRLSKYLC